MKSGTFNKIFWPEINFLWKFRYLTTCGGTNYGEGGQKVLVWRTKQHQIELFDFHLRNQELNDAVTINFPRRVQVLPHVSVLETEKRITLVIATQGSFHTIELSDIPGTSIISVRVKNSVFFFWKSKFIFIWIYKIPNLEPLLDLTSSSFNKSFHIFKNPIAATFSCTTIDPASNNALLVVASKSSPTSVFTLQRNSNQADTVELKTQTMFGRLLWASSGKSSKICFRVFFETFCTKIGAIYFGPVNFMPICHILKLPKFFPLKFWKNSGKSDFFVRELKEFPKLISELSKRRKFETKNPAFSESWSDSHYHLNMSRFINQSVEQLGRRPFRFEFRTNQRRKYRISNKITIITTRRRPRYFCTGNIENWLLTFFSFEYQLFIIIT